METDRKKIKVGGMDSITAKAAVPGISLSRSIIHRVEFIIQNKDIYIEIQERY
jgi:hypothetical protein